MIVDLSEPKDVVYRLPPEILFPLHTEDCVEACKFVWVAAKKSH